MSASRPVLTHMTAAAAGAAVAIAAAHAPRIYADWRDRRATAALPRLSDQLLSPVAVFGPAGAGVSTAAQNLAAVAAASLHADGSGRRVLLIDADFRSASQAYRLAGITRPNVLDLVSAADEADGWDQLDISRYVLRSAHAPGLDLLAAPETPSAWEDITADDMRNVLAAASSTYALVVVDAGAGIDDAVQRAMLEASERGVLCAAQEISSMARAYESLRRARALGVWTGDVVVLARPLPDSEPLDAAVSELFGDHLVHRALHYAGMTDAANRGEPAALRSRRYAKMIGAALIDCVLTR